MPFLKQSRTRFVRITYGRGWYTLLVGQVFKVEDDGFQTLLLCSDLYGAGAGGSTLHHIERIDCEEVADLKETTTDD